MAVLGALPFQILWMKFIKVTFFLLQIIHRLVLDPQMHIPKILIPHPLYPLCIVSHNVEDTPK